MRDKLWSSNTTVKTSALARFIDPCNKSWENRLKVIRQIPEAKILHGNEWPQRGSKVSSVIFLLRCLQDSYINDTILP